MCLAARIQNKLMPGRRGYAGERGLCIPALLPRVARELIPPQGGAAGRMASAALPLRGVTAVFCEPEAEKNGVKRGIIPL